MKKFIFLFGALALTACSSISTKQVATSIETPRRPAGTGTILSCFGKFTHKKRGPETERLEIQADGSGYKVTMTTNNDSPRVIDNINCEKTSSSTLQCSSLAANTDSSDTGTGYKFQISPLEGEYLITGARYIQFGQRTFQQIYWAGSCTPEIENL